MRWTESTILQWKFQFVFVINELLTQDANDVTEVELKVLLFIVRR